jgi:exodeoxyribonuclease V alpha subunit
VFLEVEDSDEMPAKLAGVVAKSLPKLGYSSDDITVLSPMQRGSVGARNLNEVLQGVLNPPRPDKAEHRRGPVTFRVGDRVMQRVNNYDKNVFNGDVGQIIGIDAENQIVGVQYPEQAVEYDFADMDQLAHAFSLTVHKSQGSEYPACVIALHTQHYMMLARNLVYTALTRAKKLAVFVGSKRAIMMAVRNKRAVPRNTRLAQRLQRLVDDLGPNGLPRAAAKASDPNRANTPPPALPGRLL